MHHILKAPETFCTMQIDPARVSDKLWVPCRTLLKPPAAGQSLSAVALRPAGLWFLTLNRVI